MEIRHSLSRPQTNQRTMSHTTIYSIPIPPPQNPFETKPEDEEKRFELRGYYKAVWMSKFLTREEYAEYRKLMKEHAMKLLEVSRSLIGTVYRDEKEIRERLHLTMAKRVKSMLLGQKSDNKYYNSMTALEKTSTWFGHIYLLIHLKEIENDEYNGWSVIDHKKKQIQ